MIEAITTFYKEPGAWVLTFLMACGIMTLIPSLLLRRKRAALLTLVNEIIAEDRLTKADKAWLIDEIERSKGTHLLIAAPFAPFFILAALALAAYEGWVEGQEDNSSSNANDPDPEQSKKRLSSLDGRIDTAYAKIILETRGVDPRTGVYWNDKRRAEIEDLALAIETWNNPLAMTWIALWLVLASPMMVVAYFASGSLRPFILNIWEPLRDPILSVLSATRLKQAVSHG